MDRIEHLQGCKDRAMEYVEDGDIPQGLTSFISDMRKHPETQGHSALDLMGTPMFSNMLNTYRDAKDFILGFN